jgi:2-polyprenyl-3-methyl-5-hydroxy-6-metoxy-1,4-benzoquinol methylase
MTQHKVSVSGEAGRGASALARFATASAVRRQRRVWSGRVASWDQHGSAGLASVTAAAVAAAAARPGLQVVDLGCGNGQLSLPLGRQGADVLAVDVSTVMTRSLQARLRREGLLSVQPLALPIEELRLPPGSLDLVVSSYALHHLRDADKARLVAASANWLRPGGHLVIADMMLGRGGTKRDRQIIAAKVAALAKKGPGGWWRIGKNAVRYLLRVQERPISLEAWAALLAAAGFTSIKATAIVAEAGLVSGQRPASLSTPAGSGTERAKPE